MDEQVTRVTIVTGASRGIAAAVALLAGPDGRWINGQTLRASGGII